jgi:hypothetical protein
MAEMSAEVYDALLAAGAPEEKARAAAAAVVGLRDEPWKRSVEKELASMRVDLAVLTGKVTLLQWMLGFNLAFSVAILWQLMH